MLARRAAAENPPGRRCGHRPTVRNGRTRGRPRGVCAGGAHCFGPTIGTPLDRLKTPPAEVARALRVVLRRGRLPAAAVVTGHPDETIARWLRRAAAHAEAVTAALVHDVQVTAVEVDACWSFVHHTGALPKRPASQRHPPPRPAGIAVPGGAA